MIGIILTIFLLPGIVEAQSGCDSESLIRCINSFANTVNNHGDISNPDMISAETRDGLCREKNTFESCINNLPGCRDTGIIRQTLAQIYNVTRIDVQVLCGVMKTTSMVNSTSHYPWGTTPRTWGTTHWQGQGCTTAAIASCMQDLRWSFDPNHIEKERICPKAAQAVGCLNKLVACLDSTNMDYKNAFGWINEADLIRMCDIMVFPVSKGAAIHSMPPLLIVGVLSAVTALF